MDQPDDLLASFFCVPDITGFTRLIATADINFTREMIPSLLRRLIDANMLKMNIGEIEGDAIFFYRTGRLPSVKLVVQQCKLFYKTFTDYIQQLKTTHPEHYKKHLAHGQLGLKIIIHYGNVCTANIKGRTKLIGKDVIIAHRLLKNAIPQSEYILFTESYLKKIRPSSLSNLPNHQKMAEGAETYDYIGEVKYRYIKLK